VTGTARGGLRRVRGMRVARWMATGAALAAAVPLRAQPADTAASCVPAPAPAPAGLARRTCAGTEYEAAVRFSVALPADWEVASPRDAGLQVWALHEGVQMSVAAEDQLHDPLTRSDTLGFWMRAARLRLGREPTLAEVEGFRQSAGRPSKARSEVTRAQRQDAVLMEMARGLSAAHEGEEVSVEAVEVRRLGGQPAGYLAETYEVNGEVWRAESYVTVRDAVVFTATLTTMGEDHHAVLPLWERVIASLQMRTERAGR
jgi:hypothetical protein